MTEVVLITGGSRGIGAAVARLLPADTLTVITYRVDADSADALVAELEADGRSALAVQVDVGRESDIAALFDRIDRLGPLTGLVNNAGIVDMRSRFDEMDWARWETMLRVNVLGSFECARQAVRRMSHRYDGPGGSIVNVSSVSARTGSPDMYVDYAASKAAIDVFTRGLAVEVADEGVRVNAVRPGITHTAIHADSGDIDRPHSAGPQIPMGRAARPAEIAEAVVWLLSDAASYVTGAVLDVTGGR